MLILTNVALKIQELPNILLLVETKDNTKNILMYECHSSVACYQNCTPNKQVLLPLQWDNTSEREQNLIGLVVKLFIELMCGKSPAKLTFCGDTGIGSGFSQGHIIFTGWNGIFVFLGCHRLSHNPKYMVNKNKPFPVTEFGFPFALDS